MPIVESSVTIENVSIEQTWAVVRDFESYPKTMRDVVSVRCYNPTADTVDSAWEVLLNGSILTWTERDWFEPDYRIRFEQLDGDLEIWTGTWSLRRAGERDEHVVVDLRVHFDIGIPSLADLLNPIGIASIKSNSEQMLQAIKLQSASP